MMHIDEWMSLKKGDCVRHIRTGTIRKIIKKPSNGCVTFRILRRSWTNRNDTVYAKNDRHLFERIK